MSDIDVKELLEQAEKKFTRGNINLLERIKSRELPSKEVTIYVSDAETARIVELKKRVEEIPDNELSESDEHSNLLDEIEALQKTVHDNALVFHMEALDKPSLEAVDAWKDKQIEALEEGADDNDIFREHLDTILTLTIRKVTLNGTGEEVGFTPSMQTVQDLRTELDPHEFVKLIEAVADLNWASHIEDAMLDTDFLSKRSPGPKTGE